VSFPFDTYDPISRTRVGWTVGGGIEYAVTNNWSLRVEYRYSDFGHASIHPVTFDAALGGGADVFITRRFSENRVQAGFSYRFDTAPPPAPPPVVAKY
jgi:outer membrane immunogenic protein